MPFRGAGDLLRRLFYKDGGAYSASPSPVRGDIFVEPTQKEFEKLRQERHHRTMPPRRGWRFIEASFLHRSRAYGAELRGITQAQLEAAVIQRWGPEDDPAVLVSHSISADRTSSEK